MASQVGQKLLPNTAHSSKAVMYQTSRTITKIVKAETAEEKTKSLQKQKSHVLATICSWLPVARNMASNLKTETHNKEYNSMYSILG